jgi:hypothetical protein
VTRGVPPTSATYFQVVLSSRSRHAPSTLHKLRWCIGTRLFPARHQRCLVWIAPAPHPLCFLFEKPCVTDSVSSKRDTGVSDQPCQRCTPGPCEVHCAGLGWAVCKQAKWLTLADLSVTSNEECFGCCSEPVAAATTLSRGFVWRSTDVCRTVRHVHTRRNCPLRLHR